MNRMLIERHEVSPDGTARIDGPRARHIREILRAGPGCEIRVGLVDGPKGRATLLRADDERVELACRFEDAVPTAVPVDVILALPRPKVMRRLWAPLAAIGVGRIFLTNAEKVERQYFDTHWLTESVYRRELILGLEQAGDTRLPAVRICRRLKPFVEDELDALFPSHLRLLAHPGPAPTDFSALSRPGPVALAVGPEGGWTAYEQDLFLAHGFHPVSLGPRTLRVDSACIALLGLIHQTGAFCTPVQGDKA
ncbi:MAG: 16S rRNA (uracil(1498)-N(3))-methyltransferase [Kiritimatiellae bacterium]|nr:16S rRNA (uracil(1498)-N(3))-methyltransferase [Kiritimatiellia bacterium]